jgi:hypothetical protein
MKDILPLKDQRLLYHNIFWAIYQTPKVRVSVDYTEGMKAIQKVFTGPRLEFAKWTLLEKIEAFLKLIEIDSKVSGSSVDCMNTTKTELLSSNPVQVKMFKIHKAFAKFLHKSKDLFQGSQPTNVEPLMSGFVPLTAFKVLPRILPRAFKNVGFSKMLLTALRRRFVWTMGFTGIMGIASWFHGVPFVLGILLTI